MVYVQHATQHHRRHKNNKKSSDSRSAFEAVRKEKLVARCLHAAGWELEMGYFFKGYFTLWVQNAS